MRKKKPLATVKLCSKQAVKIIHQEDYLTLLKMSVKERKRLLEIFTRLKRDGADDELGEFFYKNRFGLDPQGWRKAMNRYKNIWITAMFNPAYPEVVLNEIREILIRYNAELNFLGLRLPKEKKRGKPPLPKKPSNYPSKIIQRCQSKIKRQVGKCLKGKTHEKLKITIGHILADEFDNLRRSIGEMRLTTSNLKEPYYDAMDFSVSCGDEDPSEYADKFLKARQRKPRRS